MTLTDHEADTIQRILNPDSIPPLEASYASVEIKENIGLSRDKEAYSGISFTVRVDGKLAPDVNPTLAVLALNHCALTALTEMKTAWVMDGSQTGQRNFEREFSAPAELLLNPSLMYQTLQTTPVKLLTGQVDFCRPAQIPNWVGFHLKGTDQTAFITHADLSRLLNQQWANEIKATAYESTEREFRFDATPLGIVARREAGGFYRVVEIYPIVSEE